MDKDILGTTTLESMPESFHERRHPHRRVFFIVCFVALIAIGVWFFLPRAHVTAPEPVVPQQEASQASVKPEGDDLQAAVNVAIPSLSDSF